MNNFIQTLNSLKHDIKAEVIIANLFQNGIPTENILIDFKGSHRKNWDHDILSLETIGEKLLFRLSRDGIFHSLPEYLFLKKVLGTPEEKEEIRKFNKIQERNAKLLFNPVESAMFQHRIDLEKFDNLLSSSLTTNDNDDFQDFWRIDTSLDKAYRIKLMKVIPFLHSIVGDFNLTTKCLEFFLETTVSWEIREKMNTVQLSQLNVHNSDSYCGENMITQGEFHEYSKTITYSIGPVGSHEIMHYLDNGKKRKLISSFFNYFVPLEYDLDLVIEINKSESDFSLNDSYLGLNSSINPKPL
jgi:hypothetical protein